MSSPADRSEQELISALREGDQAAFRQIFDRHYAMLVTGLHRFVSDAASCEDLVQEVFADLWTRRQRLDIHTSLGAYLRRAAVNRALNYLKQQQRSGWEELGEQEQLADTAETQAEAAAEMEIREEALFRAIESLPEKCRIVFMLSRFEQLSHKEIAAQLNISTKTIENQITRALRLLRQYLEKEGGMSPAVILLLIWCGMG